jgi:hypothetical protein
MERLQILNWAHAVFHVGFMMGNTKTSKCEIRYLDLFKDIKEHGSFWWDEIFCNDGNYVLAERSSRILGTLATIQRCRGDLQGAEQTIQVYSKVILVYQGMCDRCTIQEQKDCCESLTYKHDLVVSNTYQELQIKAKCVPYFRRAVEYELKHDICYQDQNVAFVVPQILGMNNPKYSPLTIPKFRDVPDSKIWKCLMTSLKFAESGNTDILPKLPRCLGCDEIEPLKGQFQKCSACKTALYCSVACQRKHWKVHKPECQNKSKAKSSSSKKGKENTSTASNNNTRKAPPKAKTSNNEYASTTKETETTSPKVNVRDISLQQVAETLAQNFATTVLSHTKHLISRAHVEGCQPRLVERMKQLLVTTCPHLNCPLGFSDGGRDPIFLQELDNFFVQQPGYEKLEHILKSQKTMVDAHRKATCSPSPTVLRVDQEHLEERAKSMVDTVAKAILYTDPNFYVTKAQRKKACAAYVDFLKNFMVTHSEYNSYQGMGRLVSENPDGFLEKRKALIAELLEVPVPQEE